MLTEIRHRNIVRLHGFCLHNQCMFLIYAYMERGSLFSLLSNDVKAVELDWIKSQHSQRNSSCIILHALRM